VDVYRYCCFALGNLVTSMVDDAEGSFKQVIEQERVIVMMLDMLRLKFDNWQLVQQICFAIGNLAFIGDFEEIIIAKKGIELVLAAMKMHDKHPLMMTDAIFFLKKLCLWRKWAYNNHSKWWYTANSGYYGITHKFHRVARTCHQSSV